MEFDEQFIEDIPQLGIGGFLNKTFKSVKKAVKKIAPIVGGGLGFMIGGAAGAGIGAGIGGLIAGQKADAALRTALVGYGIGSVAGSFGPFQKFAGQGFGKANTFGLLDKVGADGVVKDPFNLIQKFASVPSGNADKVVKDPFIEFAKEKNMLDSSGNLLANVDAAKAKELFTESLARGSSKLGAGDVFSKSNLLVGGGLGALSYLDAKKQAEDFEAGDPNALNSLYYSNPEEFQVAGQGVKPLYYENLQDEFGVPITDLVDDFQRPTLAAEGGIMQLSNGGSLSTNDLNDSQKELYTGLLGIGYNSAEALKLILDPGPEFLKQKAEGGIINLADGSKKYFPRKNGEIDGPGTGTSDDIPAMLSDGEFVFTAKAVNNAGDGDRREGAKRMYQVMKSLEKGGTLSEQSRGRA
tara:strand:+ start:42 stop:1274 length:1233 start_codon:yes stop_codon:yes gene_type:complete